MWNCDRIMGGGKWRTEHAYNPCSGGLSHNFMTLLLFVGAPIVEVCAAGQVLTYNELKQHGGFDTMKGILRFANDAMVNWDVCLAVQGPLSSYAHRTVTHVLQFQNGSLAYGPTPESDQLIVGDEHIFFDPIEPSVRKWEEYNINVLYKSMYENILASMRGEEEPLHTIEQGINVAATCAVAFESAHSNGQWLEVPF